MSKHDSTKYKSAFLTWACLFTLLCFSFKTVHSQSITGASQVCSSDAITYTLEWEGGCSGINCTLVDYDFNVVGTGGTTIDNGITNGKPWIKVRWSPFVQNAYVECDMTLNFYIDPGGGAPLVSVTSPTYARTGNIVFCENPDNIVLSEPLSQNSVIDATTSIKLAPGFNTNGFTFQASIITAMPIEAPTNLLSSEVNQSGIKLTWTDNSDSETGFVIERSDNTNTNYQPIGSVVANNPVFFDYTVDNSSLYYYRVKSYNVLATSNPSGEVSITSPAGSSTTKYTSSSKMNSVLSTVYDEAGNVVGQSISYSNSLGKPTQSISRNVTEGNVTAAMTLYDSYGRGVVSTLPAVVDQQNLDYIQGFVTNSNGIDNDVYLYNYDNFDGANLNNPEIVNASSPLGKYYSNSNTFEDYVPTTGYPYTRVEYSEIQPGAARRSTLAGDVHRMGQGHEIESYSMQVPDDELSDLATTTFNISGAEANLDFKGLVKTISIDPDEKIGVTYTNADGNVVAACLGNGGTVYEVSANLKQDGFLDFHVPVGCGDRLYLEFETGETYELYNLANDAYIGTYSNSGSQYVTINPGFYRIVLTYSGKATGEYSTIKYDINYDEHSFSFYDKTGQLKYSLSPKGYEDWLNSGGTADEFRKLASEYNYNSLGWLLSSSEPDIEQSLGLTDRFTYYKYRKDGSIRFSQNPQQKVDGKFSYTNYDDLGRIIESGECDEGTSSGITFLTSDNLLEDTYVPGQYGPNSEATEPTYCHDQTYYQYDEPADDWNIADYPQNFTIGAVSKTWNANSSSWYSYTYDGKIEWIAKQVFGLDKNGDDVDELNITEYSYDFNGNVTEVKNGILNNDGPTLEIEDQFTHDYVYDADKRLEAVYTTDNNQNTRLQAHYSYYNHGPLKRTEIGGNLQGLDYVYTINGWLKSMNHPSLAFTLDPGHDGDVYNPDFKADAFGMTLDYYTGDYTRTGSDVTTSPINNEYYNGNISAQRWRTKGLVDARQTITSGFHWGYYYNYDKHNWLQGAFFMSSDGNTWEAPQFMPGYNVPSITYDLNGNIKTVDRNCLEEEYDLSDPPEVFLYLDDLTYHYYGNTNKLHYIDDGVGATKYDDIGDQSSGNYVYNNIGQLVSNVADGHYFEYNVYGKVSAIYSDVAKTTPKVFYYYDENGYRVAKEDVESGKTTWYVRDNSGNILSIYTDDNDNGDILPEEFPIYASSRIGTALTDGAGNTSNYVYEITDHLGNVRATLGDDYFTNNTLLSYADYYPMGMVIPGREKVASHEYRFGYQGQFAEKDCESGYNQFEARLYDSRIGRWMVFDPAGQFNNPYLGMGNNWVNGVDPNGTTWFDDFIINSKTGKVTDIIKTNDPDRVFLEDGTEIFNNEGVWDLKNMVGVGDHLINFVSPENINWMMNYSGVDNFPNGSCLDGLLKLFTESYNYLDFANMYLLPYGATVLTADSYPVYYVFGNQSVAYNTMDAGNFLWGYAGRKLGAWKYQLRLGSNLNARFHDGEIDTEEDQRAIFNGYNYGKYLWPNKSIRPNFIINELPRPRRR